MADSDRCPGCGSYHLKDATEIECLRTRIAKQQAVVDAARVARETSTPGFADTPREGTVYVLSHDSFHRLCEALDSLVKEEKC